MSGAARFEGRRPTFGRTTFSGGLGGFSNPSMGDAWAAALAKQEAGEKTDGGLEQQANDLSINESNGGTANPFMSPFKGDTDRGSPFSAGAPSFVPRAGYAARGRVFRGPSRGRGGPPSRGGRGGGFNAFNSTFNSTLPDASETLTADEVDTAMSAEEIALLNKFLHKEVKHILDENMIVTTKSQRDPNSPLHSVCTFESLRLSKELLSALKAMHFVQPSKIQEVSLPILLMEPPTNVIAQAQSGTGKTAAFVLTMLSRVDPQKKSPQCLCLAPTMELAKQIGEVVTKMASDMPDVKVHYAVKGTAAARGSRVSEQIIIGTPGKVLDYLQKLQVLDPRGFKCFVLDEADVMISQQGHRDLSVRIFNILEKNSPGLQSMLFSATYDEPVQNFAKELIKDPFTITLRREEETLPNIRQYYVECKSREAKYQAVIHLYSGLTIASAIIFCHTRVSAGWLAHKLKTKGHEVVLLHGELSVEERAQAIADFRDGRYKVLVTTNVCARGIDVPQVTIVINYDPPVNFENPTEPDYETYLHRIGRTGRFGKIGIAINFVDSQPVMNLINKIEEHFQVKIDNLDPANLEELEAIEKED